MSLKSIKKNYINFLNMFKEMGVTLNESQKETLDTFMLDLESTIEKTRYDAIRATKKIVEEKIEKDYQNVIGSIFENQKKIDTFKGLIGEKINESKTEPLVDQLDAFLNEHLESVVSKKQIVDYTRLQKLESIQESLKEMLVGKTIENGPVSEMEEKINKLQKDLNESIRTNIKLSKQIENGKKLVKESEEGEGEEKKTENDEETSETTSEQPKDDAPAAGEEEKKPVEESEEEGEIQNDVSSNGDEKNLEEAIKDILENEEKKDDVVSTEKKETIEKTSTDADVEGTETETQEEVEGNEEEDDSELFQESMISWLGTLERQQYTKL